MNPSQRMCNLMCDNYTEGMRERLKNPTALAKWYQAEYLIVDEMEGPIPEYQQAERAQLDERKTAYAAKIWGQLKLGEQKTLLRVVQDAAGADVADEFRFVMSCRQ